MGLPVGRSHHVSHRNPSWLLPLVQLIMTSIKNIFRCLTPIDCVIAELEEAEHALLRAETGVEYAQSLVAYNKARVKRLSAYLKEQEAA